MGLPLLLGVAGLAGAGGYVAAKGSSDEPRESVQKDETPTATATQGQGTDGNGGQYNFSEYELNAPQQTFKSTNVAYLDKKLADGTANFWDALAAKQFLGMNLGEYGHQSLDVNFNGKHKITNLNKLYGEANNVAANADLYKAVAMSGFDEGNDWIGNIGVIGEIARDLHEIAPFMPIGKENNQYRVLQNNMAFAAAIDESGGSKPNQFTQKQMMEKLEHSSRGDNEQASLMAAQLMRNNITLKSKMDNIRLLGGQIPQHLIDTYNENAALIQALNKRDKDGDFQRKEFVKQWKPIINIGDRMQKFNTNYAGENQDGSGQTQQNTERVVERN